MGQVAKEIVNPWIIAHQPDGQNGNLEVLLGKPHDYEWSAYGVVLGDVVRHVARAGDCEPSDVMRWIQNELEMHDPELEGHGIN